MCLLTVAAAAAVWCLQEEFFLRFAEFEEMVKEHERARAIYQVRAVMFDLMFDQV